MLRQTLSSLLLEWYAVVGRDLPWRVKGGAHPNPYVVLVSEFMLQQTTVKTVIPYFYRFMERFPTINDLATASIDDVYQYWQGLGYYNRARSLHETARIIQNLYDGKFPQNRDEALKLKGIGEYTVSSFLALAFNLPETVVDGNVMRIICRLFHLTEPIEDIRPLIKVRATALTSKKHPADYASAIMDLGATVCTPKKPKCFACPWQKYCRSANSDDVENIPRRHRLEKNEKRGFVYLIRNSAGQLFIRKREEKGLLSGLYEFPWSETPLYTEAENTGKSISHVFTHFKLVLQICTLQVEKPSTDGIFIRSEDFSRYPVSTLMRKVFTAGLQFFEDTQ